MGPDGWVDRLRHEWLPATGRHSAVLGAILIALVWISAHLFFENERLSAEQAAIQNSENLAGAFDEHLSRSIWEIDRSLQIARTRYLRNPEAFELYEWLKATPLFPDEVVQVSVIDRDGFVKLSSLDPKNFAGIDLRDREHFQFHAHAQRDELFISKPIIGRTSGKWSVQLARRIERADGSFGGIIVASLDPAYLTRIYNAVNTGTDGFIRVVGIDGTVRATSGQMSMLGKDLSKASLFKSFPDRTNGWYYTKSNISDAVPRLISYRAVPNYPLIIIIGRSTQEIFARLESQRRNGHLIAAALTLLILSATAFSLRGHRQRAKSKRSLEQSNMLLNATLEHIPVGVCMFGADRKLVLANDLYSTMYGLDPTRIHPKTTLRDILEARIAVGSSPKDSEKYLKDRLADAFHPSPGYIVNELQDGRVIAISRRALPDGGSVAIHQDITAQKQAEEKISRLAHYDGLTNLANRALFLDHVGKAIRHCRSHGDRFAVHLLDLDRFKEVNDSLGHAIGDSLLFEVASRLRGCAGPDDVVARLGGDEFIVLQPLGEAGAGDATRLAKSIMHSIVKPFDIDGHHLAIETSIGIVLAPDHGLEADELLKKADLALYSAKAGGRNGWRLFEHDMEGEARTRLELAMDLRTSINRDEFELHYQPVVSLADERWVGAEALVRWRHPQRGLVSPAAFIPLAEDTGMIVALGEWVLDRACRDAAAWPSHLSVAVNLSPVQIRNGNLVEVVKRALASSGLAASRLELEVTESVLLEHNAQNVKVLRELQELGISIVLDDFGVGYSSMSYLLSFPFNKIKIDRTFVAELPRRQDCAAIVSAVSGLARSLNIETTAEGVETAEQALLLRAAGCTLAQGYLFGRPCANSALDFPATGVSRRLIAG